MDIENMFEFLVKDYGFNYRKQEFHNCFNGNWSVYTYSFFNDDGCFTIHSLPQRGELDFYYAKRFSNIREDLYEKPIDIVSIEKDIWRKYGKIGFFDNPFFWWNDNKILTTLAKVLKVHINNYGEFFGIQINKD